MDEPMMIEDHMAKNKRETVFLIMLMFLILMAFVGAIAIFLGMPIPIALIIAIPIALIYVGATYSFSVESVIRAAGARPADPRIREEKLLIYKVEEMAISAGLPTPRVYVQDSEDINAFATGKKPEESIICCTTGALKLLNNEELEGVMAHEMSHIKNNDILVATVAVGVVGAIALIAEIVLYMIWFGAGRGGGRRGGDGEGGIILLLLAIIFIILAPIFSRLTYLAISRKREYLADANGAYLTRNPDGLASALEKIKGDLPDDPKGSKTVAPLYIANPFKRALRDSMWSTHPPIDERIKRLRTM
jgi:heat shock protein HtpX